MICPNCGAELKDGASFCVSCGCPVSQTPASQPTPQQPVTIATEAQHENIVKGFIGALLGALIGGAAIFFIGRAGFVASISGVILAFLTFFLYEKLAGSISKKGIIICVILILVVPFLAQRLVWANYYVDTFNEIFSTYGYDTESGIVLLNRTYGTELNDLSLLEVHGGLDKFIEIDELNEDFMGELVKLYLFTALGAAGIVANMFKKTKK